MEAYLQWKRKDRRQGAGRLPRKPRRSVSCSFLQFSSLFAPKVPRVDLLGSLWIFYQRKARRVYSQKPSNRIGYSGVFCDILRLFDGYCWKSDEDLTEGLRNDRVREILQKKIQSPYPSPISIFLFFFFQKIDERLNEIRRSQKSCTSSSIDFTHVKLKTRSMPFTMYVREFGAAWPNPDLRPVAGRPPVKSKCMGFAGYFARCTRINRLWSPLAYGLGGNKIEFSTSVHMQSGISFIVAWIAIVFLCLVYTNFLFLSLSVIARCFAIVSFILVQFFFTVFMLQFCLFNSELRNFDWIFYQLRKGILSYSFHH